MVESFGLIGYDGMNCSQKSTPVTKNDECISQMWTGWFLSARSNSAGTCQITMARLNNTTATTPLLRKRPSARSGLAQSARRTARPTRRRTATGKACTSGNQGAPATMRIGAKNMIRMCSIMWTKK